MLKCDFNCFECVFPDCIYDSSRDVSGQFYDVSISREIDSHLKNPDYKKNKYYQEHKEEINAYRRKYYQEHREEINARRRKYYQEHKEYFCARQREYYRMCFIYGLGRKLRRSSKNSFDIDCQENKKKFLSYEGKSYKERMEEINARQRKYYQEHREEILLRKKEYYQEHREEIKASRREYYRENFIYGLGRKLNA